MNERIKQFADQARLWAYADHDGYTAQMLFEQKFAKLIVKECANFVENIFDDDGGHAPCEDYARGIKQHFGVEE